jgi:O-antigen ligase
MAMIFLERGMRRWLIYVPLFFFVMLAMVLAFSRTTIGGFFIGCLFFIPMCLRWKVRSVIPLTLGVMFMIGVVFVCVGLFAEKASDSATHDTYEEFFVQKQASPEERVVRSVFRQLSRRAIWRGSFNMIKDHPWFGVGLGMIGVKSVDYLEWEYEDLTYLLGAFAEEGRIFPHIIQNAHNLFLQVMAEMGIGGAFLIVWLYCRIFMTARKKQDAFYDNDVRILFLIGVTGVLSDLFMGFVEPGSIFGPGSLGFLFAFFASLVFCTEQLHYQ